jgi:hypothetical protein
MTANIPEIGSATAIGATTFSVDATSIGGANLRGIGGSISCGKEVVDVIRVGPSAGGVIPACVLIDCAATNSAARPVLYYRLATSEAS